MKIGVSSYSFYRYIKSNACDYIEICNKAKEMGFEGIEFIDLDFADFGITTDPMKTATEIREHCAKIGLEIIAYTIGANFLCEDQDAEVERVCRAIDVAQELGAPVLRHDIANSLTVISQNTGAVLKNDPLYSWREAVKDVAPFIRRVTEYAKAKGIRTCSENHGFIFQAPETVETLIREVGSDNYGWLIDMGNFLCADAEPSQAVHIASRYAFHVHAKDFLFKSGEEGNPGRYIQTNSGNFILGTVIGHGIVPVKKCINILKKAGYDGYVSVEFEGWEDPILAIQAGHDYLANII